MTNPNGEGFTAYTLDQLTVFRAVVEEGSFTAAGRRLGRVQSAVSYAVSQLESALGSTLFDRSGRAVVLTDAGRRLAAEARLVLGQARELSECAAQLRAGTEPELRVVVDAIYPNGRLLDICEAFRDRFPTTTLRIDVGLLGDAVERVASGQADLGACNLAGGASADLSVAYLGVVPLWPVCAAGHPLAGQPSPLRDSVLEQHIQVVQSERRQDTRDQGVLGSRTWRTTDLALKVEWIRRGIGWGSLPADVARPLVDAGELVRLRPEPWPGHDLRLHTVVRKAVPLGRAGQWVREQLFLGPAAL